METLVRTLCDGPTFRLKEAVKQQHQGFLVSPEESDRIRQQLMGHLERMKRGTILVFDPAGVDSRASCFARILGGPLRALAEQRGLRGRYLVLQGPLGSNAEDVRLGLEDEEVVAVVRDVEGPRLAGKVDRTLTETYAFVVERDEVTSQALQRPFGLTITAANARVVKMQRLGLLHFLREESLGKGGRRFVYEPVR